MITLENGTLDAFLWFKSAAEKTAEVKKAYDDLKMRLTVEPYFSENGGDPGKFVYLFNQYDYIKAKKFTPENADLFISMWRSGYMNKIKYPDGSAAIVDMEKFVNDRIVVGVSQDQLPGGNLNPPIIQNAVNPIISAGMKAQDTISGLTQQASQLSASTKEFFSMIERNKGFILTAAAIVGALYVGDKFLMPLLINAKSNFKKLKD